MGWFRGLALGWQALIYFGMVVALAVAFTLWKDSIREEGRQEIRLEVAAEKEKRDREAAIQIAQMRSKYAENRQKLRQSPDYMRPACPLVGAVIDSLPRPSTPARRSK